VSSEAATSEEEPTTLPGLIESSAVRHRRLVLLLSAGEAGSDAGDVQSMTVAPSLPLVFFPKLRNRFLNPNPVPLGDVVGRAAPEAALLRALGGVDTAWALLLPPALCRSSRFFRTSAASASSSLSMD
jgi:hypothetical protein